MSERTILLEDFALVRDGRVLVRGDRWEAAAGERILLTGPSGSGKSSFLLALAGLAPEHAPGLELRGARRASPRTGMVFQNPYSQLVCPSADDEIAFAMENAGAPLSAMVERVAELKAFFGLDSLGDRAPWTFSGGEAQRLALAAALSARPELLLLDEPLGYLDGASARAIVALASGSDRAAAWVVVDHDPAAWAAWADTHYRLAEDGTLRREPVPVRPIKATRPKPPVVPAAAPSAEARLAGAPSAGAPSVGAPSYGAGRPPVLEIDSLTAGYGKGPDVLRDFSLRLEAGETVAVVGPSGSGKSTVFRCLTGQLNARAGSIRVDGVDYRPRKRRPSPFAWVPQVPEHYFVYGSAREEWLAREEWSGGDGLSAGDAAAETEAAGALAAREFGLETLADRHPFTLSEGEKRRLNLASALTLDRRVLLLDEPQFGLDARSGDALEAALERLRAQGRSMLIISHDPAFCERTAHRVVRIGGGTGT